MCRRLLLGYEMDIMNLFKKTLSPPKILSLNVRLIYCQTSMSDLCHLFLINYLEVLFKPISLMAIVLQRLQLEANARLIKFYSIWPIVQLVNSRPFLEPKRFIMNTGPSKSSNIAHKLSYSIRSHCS